jgi:hypothetical protein
MSKISDFSDILLFPPIAIAVFQLKEGKIDLTNYIELMMLTKIVKEFVH